jgi:small subunit ribosomal protein S6
MRQEPSSRVPAFDETSSSLSQGSKGSAPGRRATERQADMALYEHIYMARQDISAQQVEALTEQFKKVVAGLGGSIDKIEYWGVKSLAYRIKKNRKAHFSLFNINAPHAAIAEMERQMGLSEDVLRFMTLRVEALEEGPSAMMRKRDDDGERGDRRGPRGDRGDRGERGDRPPRPRREEGAAEGGF